jgi:hypothetical protein
MDGPPISSRDRARLEQAQSSACSAMLSMLASLKRALGDLDRVAWLTVNGFVNADDVVAGLRERRLTAACPA